MLLLIVALTLFLTHSRPHRLPFSTPLPLSPLSPLTLPPPNPPPLLCSASFTSSEEGTLDQCLLNLSSASERAKNYRARQLLGVPILALLLLQGGTFCCFHCRPRGSEGQTVNAGAT